MALDPKMSGGIGAPPPGAPVQVTTPGSEVATAEQIMQARRNEQTLAPFVPKAMTDEQVVALLGKTPDQIKAEIAAKTAVPAAGAHAQPTASSLVDPSGQPVSSNNGIAIPTAPAPAVTSSIKPADIPRRIRRRPGMEAPLVKGDVIADPASAAHGIRTQALTAQQTTGAVVITDPADVGAGDVGDRMAIADEPVGLGAGVGGAPAGDMQELPQRPEPYRPAASDTDSPARGLPTHAQDPGKRITGGWGDAGDAQYFPLNGDELRQLVLGLMDRIAERLDDDLRFSIAAVYPRVNARVIIEVDCLAEDRSFQVVRVMPPHEKTPIAIARARADDCVFVVTTERIESLPDGTPVTAPNQTRIDLGIQVPRKQAVQTPAGRMIVDVTQETQDTQERS